MGSWTMTWRRSFRAVCLFVGSALSLSLLAGFGGSMSGAESRVDSAPRIPQQWAVTQAVGHGSVPGFLDGVSCPTSTSCVAVGTKGSGQNYLALAESLSNGAWTKMSPPPARGSQAGFLFSVSCPIAGSCIAVGYTFANQSGHALIETLTNGKWSVSSTPDQLQTASDSFLWGVSCVTASQCVAVGDTIEAAGNTEPVIATFHGGNWNVTTSPTVPSKPAGSGLAELSSVSCVSDIQCVAVGYDQPSAKKTTTLIETLKGGHWSVTPSSGSTPTPGNGYKAVSCWTNGFCTAVGQLSGSVPLVGSSTGGTWTMAKSPEPSRLDSSTSLNGVACQSSVDCVAVGDLANRNNPQVADGALGYPAGALIESESSGQWEIVKDPSTLPTASGLDDVSCNSGSCAAVGQSGDYNANSTAGTHTLILETKGS
jgi:hypothetical protein